MMWLVGFRSEARGAEVLVYVYYPLSFLMFFLKKSMGCCMFWGNTIHKGPKIVKNRVLA